MCVIENRILLDDVNGDGEYMMLKNIIRHTIIL
jgi:hypothetical protein